MLTPDIGEQYFRDVGALAGAGGPPDRAKLMEVMTRYGLVPAAPKRAPRSRTVKPFPELCRCRPRLRFGGADDAPSKGSRMPTSLETLTRIAPRTNDAESRAAYGYFIPTLPSTTQRPSTSRRPAGSGTSPNKRLRGAPTLTCPRPFQPPPGPHRAEASRCSSRAKCSRIRVVAMFTRPESRHPHSPAAPTTDARSHHARALVGTPVAIDRPMPRRWTPGGWPRAEPRSRSSRATRSIFSGVV